MTERNSPAAIDSRAYRDVIGRFATGVTVVAAQEDGRTHGMTASSVTSVSLDPLLVLVCVGKSAAIHELMLRTGSFAVSILADGQQELAAFFSTQDRDDSAMGGFPYRAAGSGSPILDGALGWLDCRLWQQYDGGDHTIVVGEVTGLELSTPNGAPLLFYAGGYRDIGAARPPLSP